MKVTIKETGEVCTLGGGDEYGNDKMLAIADDLLHHNEIEWEQAEDGSNRFFMTLEEFAFWQDYLHQQDEDWAKINVLIEQHGEQARSIMIRIMEGDDCYYTEHHKRNLDIIRQIREALENGEDT